MKRPFWMHQLVEYLLGVSLVGSGAQSPEPLVPVVLGGVLLVYAASTRGALAAFRLLPRSVHRVIDPVLAAVLLAGAVQPWIDVHVNSRFIIAAIAAVHLLVWWQSSYDEKPTARERRAAVTASRSPTGDRATDLGRTAGRMVGGGVNAVRRARARRR